MCMNCKVSDTCDCSGGTLLPACGCTKQIWCAACDHRPAENEKPGYDVLGDMLQAWYLAEIPASTT